MRIGGDYFRNGRASKRLFQTFPDTSDQRQDSKSAAHNGCKQGEPHEFQTDQKAAVLNSSKQTTARVENVDVLSFEELPA